jgi:hypothetical protein
MGVGKRLAGDCKRCDGDTCRMYHDGSPFLAGTCGSAALNFALPSRDMDTRRQLFQPPDIAHAGKLITPAHIPSGEKTPSDSTKRTTGRSKAIMAGIASNSKAMEVLARRTQPD